MAVHASHAALPYPIKGARFSMLVPLLDADGDPTAATTPDTEISEDNAAATDAAEELSATSGMDGMALITFSGAETDCSCLAVNFKAASGPKATLATLFPRVLAEVGTGTLSAGSAGGGTLGTLLAYDVTGCFIKTTGGTGGGGTGGANNQVRKIVTYNTGTGAFTVTPNWETTPSTDTTYAVLLPEGVTLGMLKTLNPTTAGRTLTIESDGMAHADVKEVGGTTQTAGDIIGDTNDIQSKIGTPAGASVSADIADVEGKVDDLESRLGTPSDLGSGATVAANLVDIENHADEVGAGGAGLTAIPWNSAWDAEVQSEVQDAIVANGLDHLVAASVAGADVADDSIVAKMVSKSATADWDSFVNTTDALEAIRDKEADIETDTQDIQSKIGTPAGASVSADILVIDNLVDDLESRVGTPSNLGGGATLAANLSDIEGQTDDIGVAGAGLTAVPWNAAWDTEVQSEVDDALKALFLDKLVVVAGTADSGSTTTMVDAARTEGDADYWKGAIIRFTSGNIDGQSRIITDFVVATDTFTFAPPLTQAVSTQTYVILPHVSAWDDTLAEHLISGSTGAALNAAGSAGDPWNTALPGAYGAGTAGKIIGDNVNATISSRSSHSAADVWAVATRTLTAFDASFKTGYALSAAGVQAIWDALTSALSTVGSIGKLLVDNINATIGSRATQTSVDDLPTNAELATALGTADDAVLAQVALVKAKTDLIPADPADASDIAASFATVEGKIDTIDGIVDNILIDTNELQTDWTNGGRLDLIIDAILADTNELQTDWVNGGRLDLLIDAIKAKTDNLPASPAAVGSAMTLTSGERDAVAAALLDLTAAIETGLTVRQALRLTVAAAAGKLSGAATTNVIIRNAVADSKNRITATVDADGNRTAVSTDLT